jgi:hypothetical protein
MSTGQERAHELLQLVDWSYSLSKRGREDMNAILFVMQWALLDTFITELVK